MVTKMIMYRNDDGVDHHGGSCADGCDGSDGNDDNEDDQDDGDDDDDNDNLDDLPQGDPCSQHTSVVVLSTFSFAVGGR